jgi:hypothetical protein
MLSGFGPSPGEDFGGHDVPGQERRAAPKPDEKEKIMRKLVLSLAASTALMLAAAPAFAATDSSMSPSDAKELCTKLEGQFKDLTPFKKGLPYWQKADSEFTTGQKDCNGNKPVVGATAMQTAISDMYVAPETL